MDGDPIISWDENMNLTQVQEQVDATMVRLTSRIEKPMDGEHRLYFMIPTPAPYEVSEAKFLSTLNEGYSLPNQVKALLLSSNGKCYAVSEADRFRDLLPLAFQLGPPEITMLAANCKFDLSAPETEIGAFVLSALKSNISQPLGKIAGLHFDSGDLMRVF